MLTKKDIQDIKGLLKDFKSELNMELLELSAELLKHFATKEELKALENKMTTGFDALMGQFKAHYEEMTMLGYHSREYNDQLENHETRISLLEKPSTPNQGHPL